MPKLEYTQQEIQDEIDSVDVYNQSFEPSEPPTQVERLRAAINQRDRQLAPGSETVLWGAFLERQREGIDDLLSEAEWWFTAYDAYEWYQDNLGELTDEEQQIFWDQFWTGTSWPEIIDEVETRLEEGR